MRRLLLLPALLLSAVAVGMGLTPREKSPQTDDGLLPPVLTREVIEQRKGLLSPATSTKLEFAGATYWVLDLHLGDGTARTRLGVYAPTKDSTFRLCLSADSWAAGNIQAKVDAATGILELRERANSSLKGQLVLACNLRTVGTQHSVRTR